VAHQAHLGNSKSLNTLVPENIQRVITPTAFILEIHIFSSDVIIQQIKKDKEKEIP
jgi:hypothetical protein